MKQGKPLITFVMVLLAAALAVYFGAYAAATLSEPFTTTLVYSYTSYNSVEADGLLAREEQVLPTQAGIVDVTRGEGEKVGAGQTVALVYRDSQAQEDQAQLQSLAMEIELLEYAAVQSGDVESAARLDEDILQSVVQLRASTALGDYSELEEQVLEVKSSVLKRGYTYGDGLTAADLTARIQSLNQEYSALRSQAASATTRVTAPQSGTYSALVDGYESLLTPQSVLALTPDSLSDLMSQGGTARAGSLGKLITSNRWYFAALLPAETADSLRAGETALLRFSGDFTQDVDMRVEQVGEAAGGQAVVVFSSDRYLERVTLLRRQTAELIFDSWSGLRIPKEALRMETYTYEDSESGQTVEENRLGVYAVVGGRLEFKEVEVVTEGETYYVVQSASSGSEALRAGDEIVVRGVGLYEGQIVN